MVLVLIWQFDSFRKPAVILMTIPFVVTGVAASLLIFPGRQFQLHGYPRVPGIGRDHHQQRHRPAGPDRDRVGRAGRAHVDAVIEAGVRRLRPIVMTTCTTALGLAPIIIARDVLFYDLAVVIAGGLIVGTILTLARRAGALCDPFQCAGDQGHRI